jgi:hypothetical protein
MNLNFFKSPNFSYRMMQLLILVLHLILLKWILYTLYEGGVLPMDKLIYHFIGIALFGGGLIRFTAWITKRQYLKNRT